MWIKQPNGELLNLDMMESISITQNTDKMYRVVAQTPYIRFYVTLKDNLTEKQAKKLVEDIHKVYQGYSAHAQDIQLLLWKEEKPDVD